MLDKERRALVGEHLWVAEAAARAVSPHPGPAPEGEDLLGEAFLALCEAALSWEPSKGSFSAYAWEKVRRAVQDTWRREAQQSLRSAALADVTWAGADPVGAPERDELLAALMLLPPSWQAVMNLCFFRGLGTDEAARLLGLSPARVSRIKRKALARLRATLLD
ncbi:sigma-70 family RNA polymerase sigma factor [Desulfovirgula thermocuniculi]|uniref:sigma-70 family RNA polymerase sigma factor n=1 Tax=Desulfovirgula thermocuniculi TaxID=348842 RepID=UPI00040764B7|nr:sigma-70 family RNA polymerase sigma factor [Desulfovirgula thermocuniculi]